MQRTYLLSVESYYFSSTLSHSPSLSLPPALVYNSLLSPKLASKILKIIQKKRLVQNIKNTRKIKMEAATG